MFDKVAVMDMQFMDDEEEEIFIPSFGQSDMDLEASNHSKLYMRRIQRIYWKKKRLKRQMG